MPLREGLSAICVKDMQCCPWLVPCGRADSERAKGGAGGTLWSAAISDGAAQEVARRMAMPSLHQSVDEEDMAMCNM